MSVEILRQSIDNKAQKGKSKNTSNSWNLSHALKFHKHTKYILNSYFLLENSSSYRVLSQSTKTKLNMVIFKH